MRIGQGPQRVRRQAARGAGIGRARRTLNQRTALPRGEHHLELEQTPMPPIRPPGTRPSSWATRPPMVSKASDRVVATLS